MEFNDLKYHRKFWLLVISVSFLGCTLVAPDPVSSLKKKQIELVCDDQLEQELKNSWVSLPRPSLKHLVVLPGQYSLYGSEASVGISGIDGQFLFDENGARVLLTGLADNCGLAFLEQAFYVFSVRRRFDMYLSGTGTKPAAVEAAIVENYSSDHFKENAFFLVLSNADDFSPNGPARLEVGDVREFEILIYNGNILSASVLIHGGQTAPLRLEKE